MPYSSYILFSLYLFPYQYEMLSHGFGYLNQTLLMTVFSRKH